MKGERFPSENQNQNGKKSWREKLRLKGFVSNKCVGTWEAGSKSVLWSMENWSAIASNFIEQLLSIISCNKNRKEMRKTYECSIIYVRSSVCAVTQELFPKITNQFCIFDNPKNIYMSKQSRWIEYRHRKKRERSV